MIEVTCLLCKDKGIETKLASKVIAKSQEEESALLGQEMIQHLLNSHQDKMAYVRNMEGKNVGMVGEIPMLAAMVNGLLVTRHFDSDNVKFKEEKEEMREKLCEAILAGASEDEEEEDEDEEEANLPIG